MGKTIREAAQMLQVSTKTIQRYKKQGKFPNAYKQNGRVFIPEEDLLPFVAGTETRADGQTETIETGTQQTVEIESHEPMQDTKPVEEGQGQPAQTQTDTDTTTALVPTQEYRHRLQVNWVCLGISYEYRKPISEPPLLRSFLQAVGRKVKGWFAKKEKLT